MTLWICSTFSVGTTPSCHPGALICILPTSREMGPPSSPKLGDSVSFPFFSFTDPFSLTHSINYQLLSMVPAKQILNSFFPPLLLPLKVSSLILGRLPDVLFYFIIFYSQREVRNKQDCHPLIHSLKHTTAGGLKLEARAQFSYGHQEINYLSHHFCIPWSTLAGS